MEFAAVLGFIALVLSIATLCHFWLAKMALTKHCVRLEAELANLQSQIDKVNHGAIGVGQRLRNVEQRLNVTAEKQSELEIGQAESQPYSKALRMLDEGAEIDQLVERSGMSKAELQLMQLLRNPESMAHN